METNKSNSNIGVMPSLGVELAQVLHLSLNATGSGLLCKVHPRVPTVQCVVVLWHRALWYYGAIRCVVHLDAWFSIRVYNVHITKPISQTRLVEFRM